MEKVTKLNREGVQRNRRRAGKLGTNRKPTPKQKRRCGGESEGNQNVKAWEESHLVGVDPSTGRPMQPIKRRGEENWRQEKDKTLLQVADLLLTSKRNFPQGGKKDWGVTTSQNNKNQVEVGRRKRAAERGGRVWTRRDK